MKPIFEYPANFANFEYLEFSAGFTKVYVDFNYDFYADDWEETFEGIHYPEIAHFSHLDCNMSPNYGKINLTLELSQIFNDATKIIIHDWLVFSLLAKVFHNRDFLIYLVI